MRSSPKPIAPCTRDFSRALSKLEVLARNYIRDILSQQATFPPRSQGPLSIYPGNECIDTRQNLNLYEYCKNMSPFPTISFSGICDVNLMFQEGLLVIIKQLCMSTVNVKRLLENGLMNSLMNLMLHSEEDDVRREAVICLSQVCHRFCFSFARPFFSFRS